MKKNRNSDQPATTQEALSRALRYLGYRPRSEAEIRTYLRKAGYPSEIGAEVIRKLRALNYVNDESFARNWALTRAQSRGYGPRRIEQELRTKGIVPPVIREAVREAFEQCDELAQARQFLTKRFRGEDFRDPRRLRRAAAFLERRGYSGRVISEVLQVSAEEE